MMKIVSFMLLIFSFFKLSADDWQRVYLATYPRSGNHWVRYVIEEATHIATSSVYPDGDPPHLLCAFPWGGFCAENGYKNNCRYPEINDIVAIKTHYPTIDNVDLKNYMKAIRIIRNPIDTFYSFSVYGTKPPFNNVRLKTLLKYYIDSWRTFQEFWNNQENVVTFRYEDILLNPKEEFTSMLREIGYEVSEEDINRAISKFKPKDYAYKHLEHYSEEEIQLIRTELEDLLDQFNYEIPDAVLYDSGADEYLYWKNK